MPPRSRHPAKNIAATAATVNNRIRIFVIIFSSYESIVQVFIDLFLFSVLPLALFLVSAILLCVEAKPPTITFAPGPPNLHFPCQPLWTSLKVPI